MGGGSRGKTTVCDFFNFSVSDPQDILESQSALRSILTYTNSGQVDYHVELQLGLMAKLKLHKEQDFM